MGRQRFAAFGLGDLGGEVLDRVHATDEHVAQRFAARCGIVERLPTVELSRHSMPEKPDQIVTHPRLRFPVQVAACLRPWSRPRDLSMRGMRRLRQPD